MFFWSGVQFLFFWVRWRVACGLGVLARDSERFERAGQVVVFKLLQRIAELPGNEGAQRAGLEVKSLLLLFLLPLPLSLFRFLPKLRA